LRRFATEPGGGTWRRGERKRGKEKMGPEKRRKEQVFLGRYSGDDR